MNEHLWGNVGVLDEVVRYAIVVATAIAAGVAISKLGPDFLLLIIIPAGWIIAYMLLSSAAHADAVYAFLGVDTRHRHVRRRRKA